MEIFSNVIFSYVPELQCPIIPTSSVLFDNGIIETFEKSQLITVPFDTPTIPTHPTPEDCIVISLKLRPLIPLLSLDIKCISAPLRSIFLIVLSPVSEIKRPIFRFIAGCTASKSSSPVIR